MFPQIPHRRFHAADVFMISGDRIDAVRSGKPRSVSPRLARMTGPRSSSTRSPGRRITSASERVQRLHDRLASLRTDDRPQVEVRRHSNREAAVGEGFDFEFVVTHARMPRIHSAQSQQPHTRTMTPARRSRDWSLHSLRGQYPPDGMNPGRQAPRGRPRHGEKKIEHGPSQKEPTQINAVEMPEIHRRSRTLPTINDDARKKKAAKTAHRDTLTPARSMQER